MMRGRAALALAVSVAVGGVAPTARAVAWPGALEVAGRALSAVPDGERADAAARLVAQFGAVAAAPWVRPLLAGGPPPARLLGARLLIRAGDPAAQATALGWLTGPTSTPGDRTLGLDALSFLAARLGPGEDAPPAVRSAFEQAARDRDALTRAEALDAIGRLDAASPGRVSPSLPVILGCLDDLDREVRVRAVRLVARAATIDRAGAAAAAPLLLERLDDSDRLVRVTAVAALGSLRDPRVVPALLRVAAADPPDLQVPAVDALGWPGSTEAVGFLATLLRRRPADEAARHAARALGQIGSPAAVSALAGALHLPPVPDEVGQGLVDAGAAAVPTLLRELDGPDLASAARALALLGQSADPRALSGLTHAVRHRAGAGPLALVAIQALSRNRHPEAVAALAEATEAAEPEVRRAALDALAAVVDSQAAGLADRGLADSDATVRAAAARLAARLQQPAPALADRLSDPAPVVRLEAARALRVIPTPAPAMRRELLARVLAAVARSPGAGADRPSTDESEAVSDAVEALADQEDAARLDAALRDGVPTRMLGAALRKAHGSQPIAERALIVRLLRDLEGDPADAMAAAEALAAARLADDDAGPLAGAARDGDPSLRARLCGAVARLPQGAGWLAVWMAAGQPIEVRAAAVWAARSRGELADLLRRLTDAPEVAIAANARAALAVAGRRWSPSSTGARLVRPEGTPAAGRWVTVASGAVAVAARSTGRGEVRVDGLPPGPVTIHPSLDR